MVSDGMAGGEMVKLFWDLSLLIILLIYIK